MQLSDHSKTHNGRCLCGAVRFSFEGKPNWITWCHCDSCRRNTSSPGTIFIGVPLARFRFTGAEPQTYASTPGTIRRFCGTCGSPVSFEAERYPDEIHIYAAAMEDPDAYPPECHVHTAEQLAWFETLDDLPRYAHSAEGSKPVRSGPRTNDKV